MSDLSRRVLTAVALLPIVIGAVIVGGWPFAALLVLITVLAQYELYGLFESAGLSPFKPLGIATGVSIVFAPLWPGFLAVATIGAAGVVAAGLFRSDDRPLENAAAGILGVIYPAALAAWAVHLRVGAGEVLGDRWAAWLTVTVLVATWAADTFAYFTGRAVGSRPLFERVSPKKTIEGAVGGVLGAVVVVMILKAAAMPFIGWIDALVLGLIAGVVGPIGDLTESLFKRSIGAKDSGTLLPGHGGVLDRIDALLFTIPLSVFYLRMVGVF
jgi:phosphatidate cytidylyltransferase